MISYSAIYSIVAFKLKEIFQEYNYTLIAPLTTNLLFIIVFIAIENYYSLKMDSGSFVTFLAPGLLVMIVAQESYHISSTTLIHMKQIGSLDDWLIAPMYRIEILLSLLITTLIIGFTLAFLNFFVFSFFINLQIHNYFYFFYYLFIVIIFFSCFGCFVGIIFSSWDSQSTFSNFFVSPINFLSGTFFSINYIPDNFKFFLIYNPYYYVVSYFRNSFNTDFNFNLVNNFYILIFIISSFIITAYIYFKGYKIIK